MSDAVRMVLEKGPFPNADQIRINILNFTVILEGRVKTETQKALVESDVSHAVGVEKAIYRLTVQN
ncbi:MAG: BON domain-containing protein [Nitrospiria bacterium]